VERELAISNESISETVRWISYGPRTTVVKYDAYNIDGYTFCTKCHDGKVYQNSGVSVEAIDMHISKEVTTTGQAFYYEVSLEIWVLDYRFKQIPFFKYDWVNHRACGVKCDTTVGYTLVDLNNLGHKVDPFILSSQARQVFYVKDQIDKKLSMVFKVPPKNYKDMYDEVDEEFSTVNHQYNDNILPHVDRRDLGNESRNDYYRTDCGEIIVVNLDSSSNNNNSDSYSTSQISTSKEIEYDSPEPPKSLLKWYHYLSDEYKDNGRFYGSKSRYSSDDSNGPSIPRVPVYGPSIQGLLDKYGYDNIKEYLSDCYFPSTDKEDTMVHTSQDPIHKCHSPKSNGVLASVISDDNKGVSSKGPSITSISKEGPSIARLSKEPIPKELIACYGYDIVEDYLPVAKKPIPKVIFKSPIPIKGCVLGLADVETRDTNVKKFGMRTPGRCVDKSKGKRKV
ncbi:hypothetical protein Tco_0762944, partial [Tanacetum coccineum]